MRNVPSRGHDSHLLMENPRLGNDTASIVFNDGIAQRPAVTIQSRGFDGLFRNNSASFFLDNGDVQIRGQYAMYSDARLKTNVRSLDRSLERILALRGVRYQRIDDPRGEEQIGLLAQEVQDVLPELVTSSGGDQLAVRYIGLVPVLVEALEESHAEHQRETQALREELRSTKERLQRIEALLEARGIR
ncbi:MAG: tail fiber domain-containing protein [Planctomycetes bacterium]|nr:tail fiber domain-containing protein [Planctomycetota bacterium]